MSAITLLGAAGQGCQFDSLASLFPIGQVTKSILYSDRATTIWLFFSDNTGVVESAQLEDKNNIINAPY